MKPICAHTTKLAESYELLDGDKAACETCADCGRTDRWRVRRHGHHVMVSPLDDRDIYSEPLTVAVVAL